MSYTFHLAYYSEVSAEITLQRRDGYTRFAATHPIDAVTIDDWFYFSSSYDGHDPLYSQDVDTHTALAKLGNALYPGAERLIQDIESVDEPKERFFTDLYLAFVHGQWIPPSDRYPHGYNHSVGERLLQRLE